MPFYGKTPFAKPPFAPRSNATRLHCPESPPKIFAHGAVQRPKGNGRVPRVETRSTPLKQTTQRRFFAARHHLHPLPKATRLPRAKNETILRHKKSLPCSAPKILKTLQRVESPKTIGTCTMFPYFAKAKQFWAIFITHSTAYAALRETYFLLPSFCNFCPAKIKQKKALFLKN